MRSFFTSTFQPAKDLRGAGSRRMPARPIGLGSYRPAPRVQQPRQVFLGDTVLQTERDAILQKIQVASDKMVAVRKWIASRIVQDPMLLKTFGQEYISDNFWGYDDLVVKDQYYVDKAVEALRANANSWDVDSETLSYVDEWVLVVNIMYDAMQEFGKTPLTAENGQPIAGTTAPAPVATPAPKPPVVTTPSGIAPGSAVTTTPPSTGIKTKDVLIYGGIGVGILVLVAALKG